MRPGFGWRTNAPVPGCSLAKQFKQIGLSMEFVAKAFVRHLKEEVA